MAQDRPDRPRYPRDFVDKPHSFGTAVVQLHPDYERAGHPARDRARAAYLQSVVAYSVDAKIVRDGSLTRRQVAQATGIEERRLRTILSGEAWVNLYDLTALGRVLDQDLVRVWQGPTFDQPGRWVTGG